MAFTTTSAGKAVIPVGASVHKQILLRPTGPSMIGCGGGGKDSLQPGVALVIPICPHSRHSGVTGLSRRLGLRNAAIFDEGAWQPVAGRFKLNFRQVNDLRG